MTEQLSFNLLDEPWIPVIGIDGGYEHVGLLELFNRGRELRSIWSADALETLALHRLAIAVTLAALTAPTETGSVRVDLTARELDAIDERGLPVDRILPYLERWRQRFWLFGREGFWQLGATDRSPVARLDPLRAVGSQAAFFDHHDDQRPDRLDPAAAARQLAVGQTFAVGAGRGPQGRAFQNGLIGKQALIAVPVGEHVAATLSSCLVAYDAQRQPDDAPVWERTREQRRLRLDVARHLPAGLLDTLTWEARAVELLRNDDAAVEMMGFAMGINPEPFQSRAAGRRTDPWVPTELRNGELRPIRARLGLVAWRDSYALLTGLLPRAELAEAPTVLGAHRARSRGRRALSLLVGGLIAEGQNTIAGALLAQLPLPSSALDELPAEFLAGLERLTADARDCAGAARRSLSRFAREYHGAENARRSAQLGRQLWAGTESAYWARGGQTFNEHVGRLAAGEDPQVVRASWLAITGGAARQGVQRALEPYADDVGLRASALADSTLRRHLPRAEYVEAA
jgi:CRISPR system Cascade subunit CasA